MSKGPKNFSPLCQKLVEIFGFESSAARPTARGGRRGSEKVAPCAFATLQRRGPQGRAHIWGLCFRAKASKDANGEARRAEPMLWSPTEYRSRSVVVLPCNVHFRAIAYQQTVLPPSRALILCALASKSQKWTISRKPEVEIWRKHAQSIF